MLNLVLIPLLGLTGGALALISGRIIRLVQYWRLIGNDQLVGQRWGALLRVVLAAAAMGGVVFSLNQLPALTTVDSKLGLLALMGAGAITYVVALVASGGIERREIEFVRNMALERMGKGSAK